jgi:hypothetical protein
MNSNLHYIMLAVELRIKNVFGLVLLGRFSYGMSKEEYNVSRRQRRYTDQ